MSNICEIFAILNISDCPVKLELCDDPSVWDLCQDIGGQKDCDLAFVDYLQQQSCTLEISSVLVDDATVTVTAGGITETTFYKFVAADGTVVQDWSTSNVFIAEVIGQYLVQVQDVFGCADLQFFEVIQVTPLVSTYTHFRLYATSNNGDGDFTGTTELELCEEIGGVSVAVGAGGTATANASHASFPPSQAFDGDRVSDAATGWVVAAAFPVWLQYEFNEPKAIVEWGYGLYPSSTNTATRCLKNVTLQGSNNGFDYVDLDIREEIGWGGAGNDEFRRFTITY